MEEIMKTTAVSFLVGLIQNASPELLASDKENVKIYAPEYFTKTLKKECEKLIVGSVLNGHKKYFMGFEILSHPYNEVVLCHKFYCETLNENLIIKIEI